MRRVAAVGAGLVLLVLLSAALADLPIHCLHDQVLGEWVFYLGQNNLNKTVRCDKVAVTPTMKLRLDLREPDIAIDLDTNTQGFWTMMYDEGFEVVVGGRKYFAFNKYEQPPGGSSTSFCDKTLNGWYHDVEGSNWGCYYGSKTDASQPTAHVHVPENNELFVSDHKMVQHVNNHPSALWSAQVYPQFEGHSVSEIRRMHGGNNLRRRAPRDFEMLSLLQESSAPAVETADLPKNFDWRNVNGVNYDGPIRVQGFCGSCYAVATIYIMESRIRIMSKNTFTPQVSIQSAVTCSPYSQGCDGGFPYLVGKYGEDYGLQLETDFPYEMSGAAAQARCLKTLMDDPSTPLIHAKNYKYVGGYFGGCSVPAMMREIYDNGPVAVSFEVPSDFMYYSGGIYHSVAHEMGNVEQNGVAWEKTSHSVSVVGWGEENGVEFWIAKNTWGTNWGENGYFRIRRGVDECAIESMAEAVTPVLPPNFAMPQVTVLF